MKQTYKSNLVLKQVCVCVYVCVRMRMCLALILMLIQAVVHQVRFVHKLRLGHLNVNKRDLVSDTDSRGPQRCC